MYKMILKCVVWMAIMNPRELLAPIIAIGCRHYAGLILKIRLYLQILVPRAYFLFLNSLNIGPSCDNEIFENFLGKVSFLSNFLGNLVFAQNSWRGATRTRNLSVFIKRWYQSWIIVNVAPKSIIHWDTIMAHSFVSTSLTTLKAETHKCLGDKGSKIHMFPVPLHNWTI